MRVEWIVNEHLPGLNPVQFGSERCAPSHAFGPAVRTHWLLHYVISVLHYREAGAIFEEMRLCAQRDSGRSAYLAGCLWKLMSLLQEEHPGADYLEKALNLMQSEYMNGITIQEIADRLGLNRSYFSELFRSRMGVAPGQYLLRLRLEKAERLMTVYHEPPATAAASVGYGDICQFSRIFKRFYGLAPREYCKRRGG